ncbi:hypothetical protein DFH09DRAFT_1106359 [Mycena vulgaris]|nr:hypothetical protein DFH09DRAFT_1106359 [Mycena vulgaris]
MQRWKKPSGSWLLAVLFQLLAIQHELGEPLDLNGDLTDDLIDGRVVRSFAALTMARYNFAATPLASSRSGTLVRRLMVFNAKHSLYDEYHRPPTYRCDDQRRTAPRKAIPATTKRRGSEKDEGEKPEKRAKPTTEVERRRLRSANYLTAA